MTRRTVLAGGRVFDGTTALPADMVIGDGRVIDVGLGLDADEAVDVTGRTLLPGLFDCHVHVVLDRMDLLASQQQPFSYQFYVAARNLRTMLDLGITTVRDAHGADLGIKCAVNDGLIPGPRMQISVAMLSQTGGHGDTWMPCGAHASLFSPPHPGRPTGIADGADEVRRKVREVIRAGADVIKVATSGGVLSPQSDPRHGHYRADELSALQAEAEAAGRPVMAHAQASEGIKAAIAAGVRSVEHGIFLDDEAISMMLDRGTWLVPTLVAPHGLLDSIEDGAALPEAVVRKARELIAAHLASFRRAAEAGVRIAMGTDCPVSPFGTNLRELELMASLGSMSPALALRAATSSAAGLLGLSDELGSLEPGKRADVVVVNGDVFDLGKLADNVEQVWKDGLLVVDRRAEETSRAARS